MTCEENVAIAVRKIAGLIESTPVVVMEDDVVYAAGLKWRTNRRLRQVFDVRPKALSMSESAGIDSFFGASDAEALFRRLACPSD